MFLLKLVRHRSSKFKVERNIVKIIPNIRIRTYYDVNLENIPEVSTALIRKTLKANNIAYEDGYTCFIAKCSFCHKSCNNVKQHTAKIYINKTTGMFMCASCKRTGQWNNFMAFSTKTSKTKNNIDKQEVEEGETNMKRLNESLRDIRENTNDLKAYGSPAFWNVLRKFCLPAIEHNTLSNMDVRIAPDETSLYFPLENVDNEVVGYRKSTGLSSDDTVLPNIMYGGVLTGRVPKSKDTAILIPNVSDFLVLLNSKVSANIVCLPNSVNNLPQYVLPSLERFKKLVIWFGSDTKSWEAARHFAKKLGENRCFLIRPTDKQRLPHLDENQDFKAIISSAQPMWHKSITTFANLRADVLSDLQNIDKVQGVKWKRYPTLNKILKGHRRGELTVFTGPTGSGKTTFISDYSLDLAMQGVNTLWGSFEIRNARLARTMLQQMAGIPLDENLQAFDHWADKFEKLPIYFMTFHGQQSIKVVMEAVEHATYVYDIAHVIIDNVQFMIGMSDESKYMDRFWKQDALIASFRQFATRKNCHVTLVIHPRKERDDEDLSTSSIFGGAKASQEADNILIIQDKRLTSVRGKKYLQVAKNRYSGDLGIMALDFDKSSLSYQQKKIKEQKSPEDLEEKPLR
ncbi:twinkle protein, mitochondrial [Anoplophora glabripennis]|uniref:twinkle protein, mitochondrial n=1 Tax=Anoplophora glabripennis TaxID=217634 RepID=UPI000875733A|nr:twinkle protein, mitochondrial [Anoplophora glabripennis]